MQAVAVIVGLGIRVERILCVDIDAAESRRLVGDRIVVAIKARHDVACVGGIRAPGRAEGRKLAGKAERAVVTEIIP